jgi:hypothetical protein
MATGIAFDKELNGRTFATKEGQTTKIEIFFEECFIHKAADGLHMHFWVEEQEGLYAWAKKDSNNPKAQIPGRLYHFIPADSKELGVQCAYKLISEVDDTLCYKGKLTIDGGTGVAQMLLDLPSQLQAMGTMFWAATPTAPVNLKPEMATAVTQQGSKGGYAKGETKSEAIAARFGAFGALVGDKAKCDATKIGLTLFLDAEPTPDQLVQFLIGMLA